MTCRCGRPYEHCRLCGSRTIYPKKFRSVDESERLGVKVTVYGCRNCNRQTTSLQDCAAKPRDFEPDIIPDTTPVKQRPQDAFDPDSIEYQQAASARAEELMSGKNKKSLAETVAIMKIEGWKVDIQPDEVPAEPKNPIVQAEEPKAMTMDEILEAMKGGGLKK